jgi:hypothetical protein
MNYEELPLSYAQQRLWFLDQLEPNSPFYNIPLALHLEGQLKVDILEKSLQEIIRNKTKFIFNNSWFKKYDTKKNFTR